MESAEAALRERAALSGQAHVFRHWTALDARERAALLAALAEIDFELVRELAALAREPAQPTPARFEPPELFPLRRDALQQARAREALQAGDALLAAGKVGYVLVAGGQASRLGYDGPKGAFPVGPLSGRTLFELHARRLRAARRRSASRTPWYVMTSRANDAVTRAYFAQNAHFGLDARDVFFFTQRMLPALDPDGKIVMAERHAPFFAPDGHGGLLGALASSGALGDMRARGLEHLSYFQVDNPLVRPADPLFLGLHALAGAQMSSKVVAKRDAHEKVGVIGLADGRRCCIEYSDLPSELREARGPDGELRFAAGNIAVHALELDFVERLGRGRLRLPWHLARKQLACIDEQGQPTQRAGIKFETFVFDALAEAGASVTLEVERAQEFSPVKNARGEDSPQSARAALLELHAGWARAAGKPLPAAQEEGRPLVEVDPLLAEDEHEFRARARAPRELSGGHLYEHA